MRLPSFNLVTQKWIPSTTMGSGIEILSLRELFSNSNNYHEIVSENPGTDLALYRFLIAILHVAHQGAIDIHHWQEIAANPGKKAIEYLEENIGLFDLLDPYSPFLQDPNITESGAGQVYSAEKIHGSNTSTVFCQEHEWSRYTIDLAAGARLLLRLQLFDVGGRKTGATASAGQMPCVNCGNTIVKGSNLTETLMLNLAHYEPQEEDRPSWEVPLMPPKVLLPTGYLGYLTYRFRRLKLFLDTLGRVSKIAVHPGDTIPKDRSVQEWEQGVPYRTTKKGVFPVSLQVERLLWRDAETLIQSSETNTRPPILNYLAPTKNPIINVSVYGLITDKAKPLQWVLQNFSFPEKYLTSEADRQKLLAAVRLAELGQQIFKSFRGSPYFCLAEVLKNDNPAGLATSLNGESVYWSEIDREFRLAIEDDLDLDQWAKTIRRIGLMAITKSIASITNYEARAKTLKSASCHLSKVKLEQNAAVN